MATPVVAGSALLLRQYFVDGYYPSGARMQRLLCLHTAVHMPLQWPAPRPSTQYCFHDVPAARHC